MLLLSVGTSLKKVPRGWVGLTTSSVDPYYYFGGLVSDCQAVSGQAPMV